MQARGFYEQIPLIFENNYGVTPDPVNEGDMIQVPFISADIGSNENMIESQTINSGHRFETEPSFGNVSVEGSVDVPIDVNYIGYWFKGMCGTPTTSVSGSVYEHIYVPSANNPSFTLEDGYPDIGQYSRFDGVKVDTFSTTFELNSELNASISLMGKSESLHTEPLDPNPTEHTIEKFFAKSIKLYVDGAVYGHATNISLEIANQLESGIYTFSSNGFRHSLPETGFAVSGSFNVLFENRDLYNDAINNVKKSIVIEMTRGTSSLKIEMPEILFPRQPLEKSGKGVVYQPIQFRAFYKNNNAGSPIKITLKNGVESYA